MSNPGSAYNSSPRGSKQVSGRPKDSPPCPQVAEDMEDCDVRSSGTTPGTLPRLQQRDHSAWADIQGKP